MMTCADPRCAVDHAHVTTYDALGRARRRCPHLGIGEAGATQPRRPITQTPGALRLEQRPPLPFTPPPASPWRAHPFVVAPRSCDWKGRPDAPCVVCGTMTPQPPTGQTRATCNDCCTPAQRAERAKRERRRARRASHPTRDALGFPADPTDVRSLVRRSGGAA